MFTEIMNKTAAKAAENAVMCDSDYMGEDGLLICGKCHTPKQFRDIVFMVGKISYCMCKCESERYNAECERFKAMQESIEIDRLRSVGIQDQKIISFTFANDDGRNTKILNLSKRYVERFEEIKKKNLGMIFHGETGTGKSFFAGCIANALIDKGYSVLASNITRLQNQLFAAENKNELLKEISRYDLLLLDDLGAERNTEFSVEQVYTIIDERYKSNKPVIATTNYSPQYLQELQDIQHRRIYDRIFEMCTAVKVEGVRRDEIGKKKTKTLAEVLYGSDTE